jgi:exopolysaccharide production protein ExoZ
MLDSIRLLRGVAVGSVVLFHFRGLLSGVNAGLASIASYGGTYGVSLFFVISGFVITMATHQKPAAPGVFMTRRIFRILPLATIATITCYGIKHWFGWGQIPSQMDLVGSLFFLPMNNQAPPFYGYRVLPVQWTLTYELVFYTVFCISLAAPRRHHYRVAAALLMMMVFGLQAFYGRWTLNVYESPLLEGNGPISGLMSLLANPIFLLFIVGIALARLYVLFAASVDRPRGCWWILPISCGVWAFSAWVTMTVIVCAVGSFVMVLLSERYIRATRWLKGLTHLGDISYSLYLIHPIVYLCYEGLIRRGESLEVVSCLFTLILLIVASIALSEWSYRWIEQPGVRLGKRLVSMT